MANQINWGEIYCFSDWGDEVNKKSVPEFPATCNPIVENGVCNTTYQWDDLEPVFPEVFNVSIPQAGFSFLDFNAYSRPTKFIVSQSGVTLLDTGYRTNGLFDWQAQLDNYLAERGLQPETITQPSSGVITFNIPTSSAISVQVFAPLEKSGLSGWNFRLGCPV